MNEPQKKALIGVGAIVFAMLIYPPYRIYGVHSNSDLLIETGYDFIFDLPLRAIVDINTLLVQWVGVLIIGAIAFFLLKDK